MFGLITDACCLVFLSGCNSVAYLFAILDMICLIYVWCILCSSSVFVVLVLCLGFGCFLLVITWLFV